MVARVSNDATIRYVAFAVTLCDVIQKQLVSCECQFFLFKTDELKYRPVHDTGGSYRRMDVLGSVCQAKRWLVSLEASGGSRACIDSPASTAEYTSGARFPCRLIGLPVQGNVVYFCGFSYDNAAAPYPWR